MNALAVIVDSHRQFLLGGVLPDYVLVQKFLYFQWLRDLVGTAAGGLGLVVF
jgi:hypothetical protein